MQAELRVTQRQVIEIERSFSRLPDRTPQPDKTLQQVSASQSKVICIYYIFSPSILLNFKAAVT
jgi:hypothetical protein